MGTTCTSVALLVLLKVFFSVARLVPAIGVLPPATSSALEALRRLHSTIMAHSPLVENQGMLLLLVIVLVICVLQLLLRQHGRRRRALGRVPSPAPDSWLLGHFESFAHPQHHLKLRDWALQCGPVYRIRLIYTTIAIVTDPLAIATILRSGSGAEKPDQVYRTGDAVSVLEWFMAAKLLMPCRAAVCHCQEATLPMPSTQFHSDCGEPNLVSDKTSSVRWRGIRKGISPAFSSSCLRS